MKGSFGGVIHLDFRESLMDWGVGSGFLIWIRGTCEVTSSQSVTVTSSLV